MKFSCIIIGAGASGLMASGLLTRAGHHVHLLEARDRIGGRICTIGNGAFSRPVDAGAEFMHGDLPLTASIFRHSGVPYHPMEGETYQVRNGISQQTDFFNGEWHVLMDAMKSLKHDVTFIDFLRDNFSDSRYEALRENVTRFVEGYDAADITRVSTVALYKEWSKDEDPPQYRPEGGYNRLIESLYREADQKNLSLSLSE